MDNKVWYTLSVRLSVNKTTKKNILVMQVKKDDDLFLYVWRGIKSVFKAKNVIILLFIMSYPCYCCLTWVDHLFFLLF